MAGVPDSTRDPAGKPLARPSRTGLAFRLCSRRHPARYRFHCGDVGEPIGIAVRNRLGRCELRRGEPLRLYSETVFPATRLEIPHDPSSSATPGTFAVSISTVPRVVSTGVTYLCLGGTRSLSPRPLLRLLSRMGHLFRWVAVSYGCNAVLRSHKPKVAAFQTVRASAVVSVAR